MSILLPTLWNKTKEHWKGSWNFCRSWDRNISEEGYLSSKDLSAKKCHPKGAYLRALRHILGDNKVIRVLFPLHSSLIVLFSISHILLFKFPFLLTSLFYETYLLIYSYMHLCFTLASPLSLLLVLPAPKHSWHYRSQHPQDQGWGNPSKPISLSRAVFVFVLKFCWADGGGLGLLCTKVSSPTPHSFIGQLKLWAELVNGNQ